MCTNSAKVYVDVEAHFCKDGQLLPTAIIWEDGRRYEIDRITQVARRASLAAGGIGIRYTCVVGGHRSYLFYEINRWFVERKMPSPVP